MDVYYRLQRDRQGWLQRTLSHELDTYVVYLYSFEMCSQVFNSGTIYALVNSTHPWIYSKPLDIRRCWLLFKLEARILSFKLARVCCLCTSKLCILAMEFVGKSVESTYIYLKGRCAGNNRSWDWESIFSGNHQLLLPAIDACREKWKLLLTIWLTCLRQKYG